MKAIALYRVSTDKQDLDMQKSIIQDKCRQQELTIIDSYEVEDVSAYSTPLNKRTDLLEIISRAENKEFEVLIVYLYDRLIRREDEAPLLINILMNNGVKILEAVSGNYLSNNTMEDKFMNYFRFWAAENESAKISRRVKDAMKELNANGRFMGGVAPIGYETYFTGETNKKGKPIRDLKINTVESKYIKRFFELYVTTEYGVNTVCQILDGEITQADLALIREHRPSFQGFKPTTFSYIVKNSIYCGLPQYNKTEQKRDITIYNNTDDWLTKPYNKSLDIVGEDLFLKAQEKQLERQKYCGRRTTPAKKQKYFAILLGKAYCSCGNHLTLSVKYDNRWRKHEFVYYACSHHYKQRGVTRRISLEKLNTIVIQQIDKYFKTNNLLDGSVILNNESVLETSLLEEQLVVVEKKIKDTQNNIDKINHVIDKDIDKIEYYIPHLERNKETKNILSKERTTIKQKLQELKSEKTNADEFRKQALDIYHQMNWTDFGATTKIINLLIDRIILDADNHKVTVNFKYQFI